MSGNNMLTLIQADFYKMPHYGMYPEDTTKIYTNFTPRKSRIGGVNEVVVFGIQYFIKEYLIDQWNKSFFNRPKNEVLLEYKRIMDFTLGKDSIDNAHIAQLHDMGYLPLKIKALPEGSLCPIGVPCLTITNTVDHAYWLPNFLETILSTTIWQAMTSATIAREYRKLLNKYAKETANNTSTVQWQGHDFSMRGMSSVESACVSGAGHLLSFTGTDTVPAIWWLEKYYNANIETDLVGASVPATEHSVMSLGTKDGEIDTFERLIDMYPSGILSIVSDTWNLWTVLTEFMPKLKDKIMKRDGKLVIRPDSGDPVDIICGPLNPKRFWESGTQYPIPFGAAEKGVIEALWDEFGGYINEMGYKVLDPHVGAIYGDSITLERAKSICERLKAKGFASTNVVLGIGSYTYQYNTRDTFGFAMKATYGIVNGEERIIWKDPITDDGTKKSAKGLLKVHQEDGKYRLEDQVSVVTETEGHLQTVFEDGELIIDFTLNEVRKTLLDTLKT